MMLIFVKIITLVYVVCVNVYSFLLVRQQKNARERGENKIKDVRLYVSAILGGGIGIYTAMLCLKYRLTNFFLMVLIPLFICATVFLVIIAFINDFWFIV